MHGIPCCCCYSSVAYIVAHDRHCLQPKQHAQTALLQAPFPKRAMAHQHCIHSRQGLGISSMLLECCVQTGYCLRMRTLDSYLEGTGSQSNSNSKYRKVLSLKASVQREGAMAVRRPEMHRLCLLVFVLAITRLQGWRQDHFTKSRLVAPARTRSPSPSLPSFSFLTSFNFQPGSSSPRPSSSDRPFLHSQQLTATRILM